METRTVIADTGFIVALLNQSDVRHQDVAPIYQQHPSILFPQTVLAEVAYLLGRDAGISTVTAFLKGLPKSRFRIIALTEIDPRQAEAFCLVALEGHSYDEAAHEMNVKTNHVGVLLNRAKAALRERLIAFSPTLTGGKP